MSLTLCVPVRLPSTGAMAGRKGWSAQYPDKMDSNNMFVSRIILVSNLIKLVSNLIS